MDGNRRDFLKLAGLTAVGATAASSIKNTNAEASTPGSHTEAAGEGVRLAMVIDLRRFSKDDDLINRCVEACHREHNVPNWVDDPKNEVKWIWSDDFETAFHSQEFHFIRSQRGRSLRASPRVTQNAHRWLDIIEHAAFGEAEVSLRDRGSLF